MIEDNNVLEYCYGKAKEVLRECSTKKGLYASGGLDGYRGVWSRDSFVSLMGPSLIKKEFKDVFRKSLITLGKGQSEKGQIPNAVMEGRWKNPDYKSIDSSLWFLIGEAIYSKRYNKKLFKKHKRQIEKALLWLSYQDIGENGMLGQLPTTDWQDAFPHKYGYVMNTQALYYFVLNLYKEKKKARELKRRVNEDKEDGLWGGSYYYSWRWKNHGAHKEIGEGFDTLGNLLAIVFDLADEKHAKKIISYIKKNKIDSPYSCRAVFPSIKPGDKEWQDYYLDCDAGKVDNYLNGGIWPFIGGFYVLALIKMKRFKEAELHLIKLAKANLKGNFPEWIHPKTEKSYGKQQAWSAGTYILAYESLKNKKVMI